MTYLIGQNNKDRNKSLKNSMFNLKEKILQYLKEIQ